VRHDGLLFWNGNHGRTGGDEKMHQENPTCHSCGEKMESLPQHRPDAEDKRWFGCRKCDRVYEFFVNTSTGRISADCELLHVGISDYRRQQKHHWEKHWK